MTVTNREVVWRMQQTIHKAGISLPGGGSGSLDFSDIRMLLTEVVVALPIDSDQAEVLYDWIADAPGDDVLSVFETPAAVAEGDPWEGFHGG